MDKTETTKHPLSYVGVIPHVSPRSALEIEAVAAGVKPCPFCGSFPVIMGSGDLQRGLMIHCIGDQCPNPSVSYYDHAMAAAVWNRRVS